MADVLQKFVERLPKYVEELVDILTGPTDFFREKLSNPKDNVQNAATFFVLSLAGFVLISSTIFSQDFTKTLVYFLCAQFIISMPAPFLSYLTDKIMRISRRPYELVVSTFYLNGLIFLFTLPSVLGEKMGSEFDPNYRKDCSLPNSNCLTSVKEDLSTQDIMLLSSSAFTLISLIFFFMIFFKVIRVSSIVNGIPMWKIWVGFGVSCIFIPFMFPLMLIYDYFMQMAIHGNYYANF